MGEQQLAIHRCQNSQYRNKKGFMEAEAHSESPGWKSRSVMEIPGHEGGIKSPPFIENLRSSKLSRVHAHPTLTNETPLK